MRGQLLGDMAVVRDDEHGRVQALVEVPDERQDLRARRRVEVSGRLVGQQDRRVDRRARARWPRAAARRRTARRAGGRCACRAGQGPGARAPGPAAFLRAQPRRCSGSATFSRQFSVGSRLKNWKMNPILSRRTFVRASSPRPSEALAVDLDPARCRAVERADQVEQRGLAGPGRRRRSTPSRRDRSPGRRCRGR